MPKGNMGMPWTKIHGIYCDIFSFVPLFLRISHGAIPEMPEPIVLPPIFVEPTPLKKKLQGRVLILKEFGIGNLPAGNADRC